MLRNYRKIAWRNLRQNRTSSLINLTGLSFSVAFCLLLFFYIRHEQSYDTFHAKAGRLYRMEMTNTWPGMRDKPKQHLLSFLSKGDDVENTLVFPLVVGPDLQRQFPEVKSITRFQHQDDGLVLVNGQVFKEKDIVYADSNFFQNFSFQLIRGNAEAVLNKPNSMVLSEAAALKYFGGADPIGKTLSFVNDSTRIFTVTGIAASAPGNSSIQFNMVANLKSNGDYEENIKGGFNQSSHFLIAELAEGVTQAQFERKLAPWVKTYYTDRVVADYGKYYKDFDFAKFRWFTRPFADCHYNVSSPWGHYTNSGNIYQLVCLVVVILLIASLNYVLLVISNAAGRSQEVGVRKILGAGKKHIILQFWVETQLLVGASVVLGLAICWLLLPVFSGLLGVGSLSGSLGFREIVPAILVLAILLGLLAGYYPALILSRMKPISIVKGFRTFRINPRFSRVMVVLQFTACVVLMLSAFVINRQMHYVNNKDLGFDKEQVLMVTNPSWEQGFTQRVRERLRNFASSRSYVSYFSGMNGGLNGAYNLNGFRLNGEQKWRKQLTVDYDYFEMLGLKPVQGRFFSRAMSSDTSKKIRPCVVNEALWTLLGKEAKMGVFCEPIRATIIGVVKNYHFETLSKKIEPEEHVLARNYEGLFMFKIKGGQMQRAIPEIEREWKTISGGYPFEYTFLDQTISKMYEADMQWQGVIQGACFFAIFIACLGLFGLSAVAAVNHTREIGIRKVLGAGVADIYGALASGFLVMVGIAIVVASPIAWWLMNAWLADFAYRIDISWWMFVIVGVMALMIALGTISYQVVRAALANPVKALRAE